jgi:hypothetical protein
MTDGTQPATRRTRNTKAWLSARHTYFDVIDTAEKAYILGLIAADGNVSDRGLVTFGLQAKDADLVRFVRDRLAPDATLHTAKGDGFVSFALTDRTMAAGLAQWGVIPRKSRTLPWPSGLGPMLRPFLLGYFDGDGSACIARGSNPANEYPNWSVCSGSERFLVYMKVFILDSTGVALEKIHHRPNSDLYQVMTTGRGAWIIDGWLHQEDGLGLARKRFPANTTDRYLAPRPPTPAEVLAARVREAGPAGLSRRQISAEIFTFNKTKGELDAIMSEVLALPGFKVERRRTVGTHSAKFLICAESPAEQLF